MHNAGGELRLLDILRSSLPEMATWQMPRPCVCAYLPSLANTQAEQRSFAKPTERSMQVMLRKRLVVLLMALVLALMSASPAMAAKTCTFGSDCPGNSEFSRGNKANDGGDVNSGGGQEKASNPHPEHGGGSGGDNGGGND